MRALILLIHLALPASSLAQRRTAMPVVSDGPTTLVSGAPDGRTAPSSNPKRVGSLHASGQIHMNSNWLVVRCTYFLIRSSRPFNCNSTKSNCHNSKAENNNYLPFGGSEGPYFGPTWKEHKT